MAKKKSENGGIGFLFIILIVLITPIVLIIGYFYNSSKFNEIKKLLTGKMSDFWLDTDEKNDFKEKYAQLNEVKQIIQNANDEGVNAGLSLNKDGSFSARSNKGKEIRAILTKYQPMKISLTNYLVDMQYVPINRWTVYNNYLRNSISFRWAFISWIVSLIVSSTIVSGNVFYAYWSLLSNIFNENKIKVAESDLNALIIVTGISIVIYFIFKFILKNVGEKYTPKPEVVTLNNVDSY